MGCCGCLSLRNVSVLISMVQMIGHILFVIASCMAYSGFLFAYLAFAQGSAVVEGEAGKIQNLKNSTTLPAPTPVPAAGPTPFGAFSPLPSMSSLPQSDLIQNLNDTLPATPTVPPIPTMPYVLAMIISLAYYTVIGLVGLFLAIILLVGAVKASQKLLLVYLGLKVILIIIDLASCTTALYQDYSSIGVDLGVENVLKDAASSLGPKSQNISDPKSQILDQSLNFIQSLWPIAFTIYEAGIVWSILNIFFIIFPFLLHKRVKRATVRGSVTSQCGSVHNYSLSQIAGGRS